jgi:hypothetical protein
MRKFIIPGSVRIHGLPGTDDNFGVRDNGAGQVWTETKKVGSINYWTGEVVLAKEYVPKVRFQDELRVRRHKTIAAQRLQRPCNGCVPGRAPITVRPEHARQGGAGGRARRDALL